MRKYIVFLIMLLAVIGSAVTHAEAFESQSMLFTPAGIEMIKTEESLLFHPGGTPELDREYLGRFLNDLLASYPCKKLEIHPKEAQEAVQKSI